MGEQISAMFDAAPPKAAPVSVSVSMSPAAALAAKQSNSHALASNFLNAAPRAQSTTVAATAASTVSSAVLAGEKEGSVPAKSKAKSKKSSGHFWVPAYSDEAVDVLYSVTSSLTATHPSPSLAVHWKVVNSSDSDGGEVSVSVQVADSPLLSANPCSGVFLPMVRGVPAGADDGCVVTLGLHRPVVDSATLEAQLEISFGGNGNRTAAAGSRRVVAVELGVTLCASLSPLQLSEASFMDALARVASSSSSSSAEGRGGSASVAVPVTSAVKPKSAFKALASFLHAHTVEAEHSKAVSMSAALPAAAVSAVSTHSSGGRSTGPTAAAAPAAVPVYFLAKMVKHAIQVDIKCPVGDSQHTAERVAQLISTALSELSL
jgi:hypothetical protein